MMSEQPLHRQFTQKLFTEAVPSSREAQFLADLIQRDVITIFVLPYPGSLEKIIQEYFNEQQEIAYNKQPELISELNRVISELQKMKVPVPVIMESLKLYCFLKIEGLI
jgi:hypothetical protein